MLGTIEFWSILISAVLSVVALVQSALASKDSKRANEISEEAKKVSEEANLISRNDLAESEKENYAIIKFASGISLEKRILRHCATRPPLTSIRPFLILNCLTVIWLRLPVFVQRWRI